VHRLICLHQISLFHGGLVFSTTLFPRWWCCFPCLGLFKNSGHVLQVRPLVWGFKKPSPPSSIGGGGGGSASSLVLSCYSACCVLFKQRFGFSLDSRCRCCCCSDLYSLVALGVALPRLLILPDLLRSAVF
jgi:hypothetical protein